MIKWLKKWMPTSTSIKNSKELKGLKPYLSSSTLWKYDCESIARAIAAGLAGSVIPGFQFLYAALLVILLRGNLPIALLATFITNPFTAIPVTYFIYFIGSLFIKNGNINSPIQRFKWDFSSFHVFWSNLTTWLLQFSKAYLIGLPIVSICLGIIGYFGTIFIWKTWVMLRKKFHK